MAEAVEDTRKVRRTRSQPERAPSRGPKKKPTAASEPVRPQRRADDRQTEALRNELFGIAVLAASVGLILALTSFNPDDVRASGQLATTGRAHNLIGPVGAYAGDLLLHIFGLSSFLLPLTLTIPGLAFITGRRIRIRLTDALGYPVLVLACATAAHLWMAGVPVLGHGAGGLIGTHGGEVLLALFGLTGAYIVVYSVIALTFIATTRISLVGMVGRFTKPLAAPAVTGAAGVQRHAQGLILRSATRLKAWRLARLEVRNAKNEVRVAQRAAKVARTEAQRETAAAARRAKVEARTAKIAARTAKIAAETADVVRSVADAQAAAVSGSQRALPSMDLDLSGDAPAGAGRSTRKSRAERAAEAARAAELAAAENAAAPSVIVDFSEAAGGTDVVAKVGIGARLGRLFGRGPRAVSGPVDRPEHTGAFSLGGEAATATAGFSADLSAPIDDDRDFGARPRGARRNTELADATAANPVHGVPANADLLRHTPAPGAIADAIQRSERRLNADVTEQHVEAEFEDPLDAEAFEGANDTMLAQAIGHGETGRHAPAAEERPRISARNPSNQNANLAQLDELERPRGRELTAAERHAATRDSVQQAAQLQAERAAQAARAQAERAVQAAQVQAERAAREAQILAEHAAKAARLEAERAAQAEQARAMGLLRRDTGVRATPVGRQVQAAELNDTGVSPPLDDTHEAPAVREPAPVRQVPVVRDVPAARDPSPGRDPISPRGGSEDLRASVQAHEARLRAAQLAEEAELRDARRRAELAQVQAMHAAREAEALREAEARALQARREAEAAKNEALRQAQAGKPGALFGAGGGGIERSSGGLGGGSLAGIGGSASPSGRDHNGSGLKLVQGRKAADPDALAALDLADQQGSSHVGYVKPSLHFLDYKVPPPIDIDPDFLHDQADRLVEALRTFRIDGRVTEIHPGPVITMFEFEPAPGVRISRIAGLADDLAMALKAVKVRIVAPIPGKGVVGFEVPNEHREMVFLKEIIGSEEFRSKGMALPMALGKDIHGEPAVTDLAKMPHLLVAGTTGSGKSVGVNGMITSLLYHLTPDEVRFIMVDPKMLELSIYEGIPHLLLPVVTDPKKAALALKWGVDEMERRYETMKDAGVRDIKGYNLKVERYLKALEEATVREANGQYAEESDLAAFGELFAESEPPRKLPYIVVVIDEFADLMMVAGKEVEYCVARIAQKARAAGIHLILATQRPSTDVITGVIKANFPTRMAFRVSSGIDSRTILSTNGAENLLGQGDMLFMPPGTSRLMRVHGAYVSEDEIHKVVEFIASQGTPDYLDESILADPDEAGEDGDEGGDQDTMYEEAVRVVARDGKASTSHLQRRLSLGYNRAARIVDQMERDGLVGPANGAKPRQVNKPVINELVARWES